MPAATSVSFAGGDCSKRRSRSPSRSHPATAPSWRPASRSSPASDPKPGGRIPDGELLFDWRDRWRVAYGEVTEPLDSPIAGIVKDVRPGIGIVVRATGRGVRAIVTLGGPTRGQLHVASWV